ncbi:hypothetical protein WHT83_06160 [Aminobacter sp. P9b]|uniref:hypothetical protein n=1 Tax=Aminobacter sp. P9b TaxID=3133697 RepID=UPI00324AF7F2
MTANTPRLRMTDKRRQHIFSENCTGHNVAPCCICGKPIHRHNDRWIVEHKRALALLGPDTNTNCGPAHYDCAQVKTHTEDLPRIRKAKRQQARHEGTHKPSRGFKRPDGLVYDWQKRRYVRENAPSE